MAELPNYIVRTRVTDVQPQLVTVELAVDPDALRAVWVESRIAAWVADPAHAGLTATQLTCVRCRQTVMLLGPSSPHRWICACGYEQEGRTDGMGH